jgi:uncharacterized protein (TIGR00730 family)
MKQICVFAGSRLGSRPEYEQAACELGRELVARGFGLVYGGASVGMMGAIANTVLEEGGEVIGVLPKGLFESEKPHHGLTHLYEVKNMHERKALMADLSDGFIALPGGFGTFDELFEIITWAQIKLHSKPIGLLNSAGYFDPLLTLVRHMAKEGFISPAHLALLHYQSEASTLLKEIQPLLNHVRQKEGSIRQDLKP